jgi:hypothetical protein
LLALDLKLPIGASIVAQALEAGVLVNSPQPDALRFMPALNVTREEIAALIDCLDAIFTKAGTARRVAYNEPRPSLRGAMRRNNPATGLLRFARNDDQPTA